MSCFSQLYPAVIIPQNSQNMEKSKRIPFGRHGENRYTVIFCFSNRDFPYTLIDRLNGSAVDACASEAYAINKCNNLNLNTLSLPSTNH